MDIPEQFSFRSIPVSEARLIILCLTLVTARLGNAQSDERLINHVITGEELTYSMNYGWFTIGKAEVFIDKDIWDIQGRPHYYIQCRVQTTGIFSFFSSTDICVESWVDVVTLLPKTSYRQFFYGKSVDIRTDKFEYKDSVTISTYVEDVDRHQVAKIKESDTLVLDLLSTYLNLRDNIYYQDEKDTLLVKMHFSNDIYLFGMINVGMEDLNQKFDFIFPESDHYKKGNEAFVLVSKQKPYIPKKLVFELTIGQLEFKLIDPIMDSR